jgi:pimeloyl-ACP methyl ester carboxylesterase
MGIDTVQTRPVEPPSSSQIAFGPFRLDRANELLACNGRTVPLRPKSFAMLAYLISSAGRLVTKQALLDALWPDTFVGDAALKTCMREIRDALGDDARRPGYVQTAHRRGYRFIAPVHEVHGEPLADAPFAPPRTHYARSDGVNVAYQVTGDGPLDLVLTMGWVSHLEQMWAEPSCAHFLARLASRARLIVFDASGTGLSDKLQDAPTAERRMQDIRSVMDAVDSREAVLFGVSDGGAISSLFASTHPERTRGLILYGAYASAVRSRDYPWGKTSLQRNEFVARIHREWGGPVGIEDQAPSRSADAAFRAWWSTYLRRGASPAPAAALARMNAALDVRAALSSIRAPTLLLHRTGDQVSPVEGARYIAGRIATAHLVELPGADHLPYVGDQEALLGEVERFLAARLDPVSDQARGTA